MPTEYVFCPEKGVSVAMFYTDSALNPEKNPARTYAVLLAVTFCQERVSFDKEKAKERLTERLDTTLFTDYFGLVVSSNPYVTTLRGQSSKRPRRDILIPFLRYILQLQTKFEDRLKKLIGTPIYNSQGSNCPRKTQYKYYNNPITQFAIEFGRRKFEASNSMVEAQKESTVGIATINLHGFGEVVWPKNCPTPQYKIGNTGYKSIKSESQAMRFKKLPGWKPLFPPYKEPENLTNSPTPRKLQLNVKPLKLIENVKDNSQNARPKANIWE